MSMLNMMVDSNPDKRPSAKDLLYSDLYLDKDQVCWQRYKVTTEWPYVVVCVSSLILLTNKQNTSLLTGSNYTLKPGFSEK